MLTAERHAGLSQFAAPFLSSMKFVNEQGEGVSPTLSALQPLIRSNGVTDHRRWESALFLKVRDEIQTGNLAIDGAKNFGPFEAFFLPSVI